jgi:hypothetical protein
MGKFVDSLIAYRILYLLVTPFNKTPAYRLGIIDDKGKEIKKMRDLNTVEERDAYTLLHRLVYRLKRIIEKIPIENKKLLSIAAAYSLIREHVDNNIEPINLEEQYLEKLKTDLTEQLQEVETILTEKKMFTFKQFTEENGSAGIAIAPANNAIATPGIAGLGKDVPVSKKAQKKYTSGNAKQMFRRGKVD